MRPTIRGVTAIAIVSASFAVAMQYTPTALNAIVTPLLVVLVVGAVTTFRTGRPEIRRVPVTDGFIGERRTVEIEIEPASAVAATVRDTVGDGVSVTESETTDVDIDGNGDPIATTTLEGTDRVSYEVRLETRGSHQFGPLTISVCDIFGLFTRRFTYETDAETGSVLVYPRVRDLRGGPGRDLKAFVDSERGDREEFDHLREYQHGDSVRDVHWKSAAKRPDADLVVTEFAADEETGSATVAAECTPGQADGLATAVASVTTHFLETGVDVGIDLPAAQLPPGTGQDHHYELLARLALLEAGELEDEQRREADVLVQADANGIRVVVDDRSIPFGQFTGDVGGRDGATVTGRAPLERTDGSESGVVS